MFVNLLTQNCQIKFFYLNSKTRDSMGRSTGYTYAKNGTVQQTVTTGYGSDGRIVTAGFLHGGEEKQFGYEYMSGTHLLEKLTMPNNMTLTQSYESHRNLLTGKAYHRGTTLVANRQYSYDTLGRPTARNTSRQGTVKNESNGPSGWQIWRWHPWRDGSRCTNGRLFLHTRGDSCRFINRRISWIRCRRIGSKFNML